MRISLGSALITLGVAILLHTTYATIQYREELKLLQEDFQSLPLVLIAELVVGFTTVMAGTFFVSGSLRIVVLPKKGRSIDLGTMRPDFISFNTRSRALPLDIPALS